MPELEPVPATRQHGTDEPELDAVLREIQHLIAAATSESVRSSRGSPSSTAHRRGGSSATLTMDEASLAEITSLATALGLESHLEPVLAGENRQRQVARDPFQDDRGDPRLTAKMLAFRAKLESLRLGALQARAVR
jgi:hypothetical protein